MTTNQGSTATQGSALQKHHDIPEDVERRRQLKYLHNHFQVVLNEGIIPWKQARKLRSQIPREFRLELPPSEVFGGVIGTYFTLATLTWRPVVSFRLKDDEIAEHIQVPEAAVTSALAWLCDDLIVHRGAAIAMGLGYIRRERATSWGFETALTESGRTLLGLDDPDMIYWRECFDYQAVEDHFKAPARD